MDGYALRAADGTLGASAARDRQRPRRPPVRRHRRRPVRPCASSPAASSRAAPTRSCCRKTPRPHGDDGSRQRGGDRRPPHPPRRPGFRRRRRRDARRPAHDRARRRTGRRRQPSLAHACIAARASPSSPPATRSPCRASRFPPGGIVSSNSHALAALVRAAAGRAGRAARSRRTTREAVAAVADAVHGGGHAGDHGRRLGRRPRPGHRRPEANAAWSWISGRSPCGPGKPLLFGRLGPVPVLGLPGNPGLGAGLLHPVPGAGAEPAVRPARRDPPPVIAARLPAPRCAPMTTARTICAPRSATDPQGHTVATPFPGPGLGDAAGLAQADALILRAPHAPALPEGARKFRVIRLDSLGI